MSGDVHVRICERVGVRLPRATRRAVFCPTKEDAIEAKAILAKWLETRGLHLSEGKTHIHHLTEGFDFLGFNIRPYPTPHSSRRCSPKGEKGCSTLNGGILLANCLDLPRTFDLSQLTPTQKCGFHGFANSIRRFLELHKPLMSRFDKLWTEDCVQ
jgi:hypothetical protein